LEDDCFFDNKYFEINYYCLNFILEYQIKFHQNKNIYIKFVNYKNLVDKI